MKAKFEIGQKVKVISPSKHSENKKGDVGFITKIEKGNIDGIGECLVYFIGKTLRDNENAPQWEPQSSIELCDELPYEELLAQMDELVEALKNLIRWNAHLPSIADADIYTAQTLLNKIN